MLRLILGFELRNSGEKVCKSQTCRGIEKEKCCLKACSVIDVTALFLFNLLIFSGD